MNKKSISLFIALTCIFPINSPAADEPETAESAFITDAPTAEELEGAERSPLVLDTVSVTGQAMEFKQEVAMRIVRQAYNSPRSDRHEDIDKWVCWLEKPTGSNFNRLGCARNGDIWALRPDPGGNFARSFGKAGYGSIMVTERPVNRAKLERALRSLPGSGDFDQEFLSMVMAGGQPPRDIPDDDEMDQFAQAWLTVDKLFKAGKSEERQIAAIDNEGLTLKRYNRIAELVEIYQSIENEIDQRLKKFR